MDPTAVQKQRAGVFTMLLILSLLALIIGSTFLYLEMKEYDMQIKAKAFSEPVAKTAESP